MPRTCDIPAITQFLQSFKTKSSIIAISKQRCKHGRSYVEHFRCYQSEHPSTEVPERIGFIDIETSNLDADYGIVLTWCIRDSATGKILEDYISLADIKAGYEDKRIVVSLIDAMKKFTTLCGHYSTRFDIPYIRARALIHGIDFPPYGSIRHFDTYFPC